MRAICAIVASLVLAGTAFGDTINVPGDYPTIQDAINASFDGDTIQIDGGTYNEFNLNPGGKAITIQGTLNGDGSLATTIDADQSGRVFVIENDEDDETVIKDLLITGGAANFGGGIYCEDSSPTITDCTISNNTATDGGGIYISYNSNSNVTGCLFSNNTSTWGGGGICCYSETTPTFTACTISENSGGDFGGGINCWDNSSPVFVDCIIESNSAKLGGGMYCNDGNYSFIDCTIQSNSCEEDGAGAYFGNNSNSLIQGCRFISNSSPEDSGAIEFYSCDATVSETTFQNNTAAAEGGAIYCKVDGNIIITNCTISDNSAGIDAGGVRITGTSSLLLNDSRVCANTPNQIVGGYDGKNNSIGETCPDNGACCVKNGWPSCLQLSEEDCLSINGSYQGLYVSCIEAACPSDGVIDVPADFNTITEAIDAAMDGDTISIAAGSYIESSLNPDGKAVTIQGALDSDGTLLTTIDAQQGGSVFVFDSGEGPETVIMNLIITGGTGNYHGSNSYGGGIDCYNSSPTISGCWIWGNTSKHYGGAISCSGNSLIKDCVIELNSAEIGGGIAYAGTPALINCIVTENSAVIAGGIYTENTSKLPITLSNTRVCGNLPNQINGPWTDEGGNVVIGICPLPGACCTNDVCVLTEESECVKFFGKWLGEGTSCESSSCPTACLGDANGDGEVSVNDILIVIAQFGVTCP